MFVCLCLKEPPWEAKWSEKAVLPKHPLTEIIALLHIGSAGYYTVVAPAGAF